MSITTAMLIALAALTLLPALAYWLGYRHANKMWHEKLDRWHNND